MAVFFCVSVAGFSLDCVVINGLFIWLKIQSGGIRHRRAEWDAPAQTMSLMALGCPEVCESRPLNADEYILRRARTYSSGENFRRKKHATSAAACVLYDRGSEFSENQTNGPSAVGTPATGTAKLALSSLQTQWRRIAFREVGFFCKGDTKWVLAPT